MMFPYPSAEGLHIGNIYAFTGADVHGRYWRLRGKTVFEPIGFDAFGIHSENYALKVQTNPNDLIPRNVANFTRQLKRVGGMFDWNHTVDTTGARVLQVDAVDLPAAVPRRIGRTPRRRGELVSVVQDRARERAGHRRFVRALRLDGRAAASAAVVLQDQPVRGAVARQHRGLDWSDTTRKVASELDRPQRRRRSRLRDGRSPTRRVRVFTTRPDTLFGATYMVLAPEHPLVDAITTRGAARRGRSLSRRRREARRRRPQKGREGKDRRLHGRLLHQSGRTTRAFRSGSRTTC